MNDRSGPRFKEKRALITGGAGSIGSATALRLLKEGAEVEIWDRSQSAIDALLQKAGAFAGRVSGSEVDVLDGVAVSEAAARLLRRWRAVDVLVNNAGGALDKPYSLLDQSDADWQITVDLNLLSAVRITRCFVPSMREQRYGRIVNVGSKAGRYGSFIDGPSYVAAKGALHSLSLQIAMEFGPSGVTCNAVCPAMVMIERVERLWKSRRTLAEREAIEQSIPLRRFAAPEDVASAIAFLGSDDASFITGMALDINGGQSMHS